MLVFSLNHTRMARKTEALAPLTASKKLRTEDLLVKDLSLGERGDKVLGPDGKNMGQLVDVLEWQGHILEVPINSVTPRPDQPRQDWDGDEQGAASSVDKLGQREPIRVAPFLHGKSIMFLIISGERRYRGLVANGDMTAFIELVPWHPKMTKLFEEAYFANQTHRPLNPVEDAEAMKNIIESMIEAGEASDEDTAIVLVAQRSDKTEDQICERLMLLELVPEIQAWVRRGVMMQSPALKIAIALREDAAAQERVATELDEKASSGKVYGRDVDAALRRVKLQGGSDAGGRVARRLNTTAVIREAGKALKAAVATTRRLMEDLAPLGISTGDIDRGLRNNGTGAALLRDAAQLESALAALKQRITTVLDPTARLDGKTFTTRSDASEALEEVVRVFVVGKDMTYEDLVQFKAKIETLLTRCSDTGPARDVFTVCITKIEAAMKRADVEHPGKKVSGLAHTLRSSLSVA